MKYTLLLVLSGMLIAPLYGQELLTTAERSDYQSTSTYEEVIQFMNALTKNNDYARMDYFARSVEGRDVPLVIIADPLPSSLTELEKDERIVVYLQANIHAGEVEGKEAAQMLARDLLNGDLPEKILENVIVLICPIVNPDGNEKFNTENRTNQNGPVNGVGVRHNGQFLDLNRDAIKLETPEIRGVVEEIFNTWDPSITVDCHTTNGSFHEEPVTFTWMVNPNGNQTLINYMRDRMMPSVHDTLWNKYEVENIYYGVFVDQLAMEKGWIYSTNEPRYLVNYAGLRNRLAILNENYVYADFKTRVEGSYHLLLSIVEYAADHTLEIKSMLSEADQRCIKRHVNQPEADSFAIEYMVRPIPEKISIKAIETDTIPGVRGYGRYRQGLGRFTVNVDYYADYYSTASVKVPFAYLLSVPDPRILDLMKTHGIKIERLESETVLEVERFNISSFEGRNMPFQGHYMTRIDGEFETVSKTFPEGTYLVRTAQPLGNLVAYLLEPQSNDGLLTWNFFDQYIVKQWSSSFNPYPVYRLMTY
jgi:hypothetical protein